METYQANLIFDEDLSRGGNKIPVGIHSNCKLASVEAGENFYDINFEDSEGRIQNVRLWEPNGKFPRTDKNGVTETPAQATARSERENLRHVVKLLHIFAGEESLATVSGDYPQMMAKAAALLNKLAPTKKLNLKLIYDSLGVYSSFGKFPDYVEQHIEGEEPKLQFTPWELLNRVEPKAQVAKEEPKGKVDSGLDALLS